MEDAVQGGNIAMSDAIDNATISATLFTAHGNRVTV